MTSSLYYTFSIDVFLSDVFPIDVFFIDVFPIDVFLIEVFLIDVFFVEVFSIDVFSIDVFSIDVFSIDVLSRDVFSCDPHYLYLIYFFLTFPSIAMASFAMASVPAQGQPGQPMQQQQVLQDRLDDPLVSEDYRGQIRDINDYHNLMDYFAAQRKDEHEIAPLSEDPDENFPDNDPAKQRELVGRLFEAMRNQTDIMDGTVKKDENKQVVRDANGEPVKRENAIIRRMREETNTRLELLAWTLLVSQNTFSNQLNLSSL